MAYDPASWQNFYVMTGGAAAALTGLLFVAMSLHAKAIMGNNFYRNRAVGTLTSLATQLLLAGAVLIPGLSLAGLGVLVEAAALYFLGVTIWAVLRRGPETAAVEMTWSHRLIELVGGATWIVLFNAAGGQPSDPRRRRLLLAGGGDVLHVRVEHLCRVGPDHRSLRVTVTAS